VQATAGRITGIVGARIVIIAIEQTTVDALTSVTLVAYGTSIAIVTFRFIQVMNATVSRVTTIIGARIVIIAIQPFPHLATHSRFAELHSVAQVPVRANQRCANQTAQVSITTLLAITGVGITTLKWQARLTPFRTKAELHTVAEIAVVADEWLTRLTTDIGVTALRPVAKVPIITGERGPAFALTIGANVLSSTNIPVIAGQLVGREDAPHSTLTTIISTEIVIFANGHWSPDTGTLHTAISQGAGILIIAWCTLMGGLQATLSRCPITRRGKTGSIHPFRLRADDQGFVIDLTFVRPISLVAVERSITEIAIFQRTTISTLQAVAWHHYTLANPLGAAVGHGAWVCIVAVGLIEGVGAAPKPITRVVRTGLRIVALDCHSYTNSGLAVVADGTRISVQTLTLVKDLVLTASLPLARIHRTRVVILAHFIAGTPAISINVHHAVTVVIYAVTKLRLGGSCITIPQTVIGAGPLPNTGAKIIALLARGGESQRHRFGGAWADSSICHALQCADPIDCACR